MPDRASADIFHLTSGGQIQGELLNPDEKPRKTYLIELPEGGRLTLAADQVKETIALSADEEEYLRIRPQYADTVEGQWQLAEWCRERKLFSQRDTHLERIVELDPDHAEARRGLGFSQMDGRWVKRDEVMRERGYELYKGRWRTRQEIELMETKRQEELAEKEWFQKIERWVGWLSTDRAAEARKGLMEIRDPMAVKALTAGLKSNDSESLKRMYIDILFSIASPEAVKTLAMSAIEDPSEEIRLTCLDQLMKKPDHEAISYFVAQLRHKDNRVVNRAAVALRHMKDPSTIGPLVDALVTTHKFRIKQGGDPNQISTTFGSGSPGGLSVGGSTKVVTQALRNQEVLDALVAITGRSFDFDKRAWRAWHATLKAQQPVEARRG